MSIAPIAPELMSPAGDWDCLRAAVDNGADAVYFGLRGGFNARGRAANFDERELPELMTFLRARGVRGYLTLNTLVFDDELAEVERIGRLAAAEGVDAVLVQDLGTLRLLGRLCPELPLHASTQMTLASAESLAEIERLGIRRVVLPRETSIEQIAAIRRRTNVELEVFVHGALCISYSGQCLASWSMGGRSGNRGQCAQPCRLPYDVLCDGRTHELRYPLSPHDLAAYDRLAELMAAGVAAMKIEGRLKSPDYVAVVTRHYRAAIDAIARGAGCQGHHVAQPTAVVQDRQGLSSAGVLHQGTQPRAATLRRGKQPRAAVLHQDKGPGSQSSLQEMEAVFSRGFCRGWLDGIDHRALVAGDRSAKQGVYLGRVRCVRRDRIVVELAGPVRRGDGVVLVGGSDRADEQGGRVFEVFQAGRSRTEAIAAGTAELTFQHGAINFAAIRPDWTVWKTDDPRAARRLRQSNAAERERHRVPLDLSIEAAPGDPLRASARTAAGLTCELISEFTLAEAQRHPLTEKTLTEQFGRLGKTPYRLRNLEARIVGRPMMPLSELGKMRRELIERLEETAARPPHRTISDDSALTALRSEDSRISGGLSPFSSDENGTVPFGSADSRPAPPVPRLHILCRTMEQVAAVCRTAAGGVWSTADGGYERISTEDGRLNRFCTAEGGCAPLRGGYATSPEVVFRRPIILDFQNLDQLDEAVETARSVGVEVFVATPRIHKPGETGVFERLAACRPNGIVARNPAALAFFHRLGLPVAADFSLNAVNGLSVAWLLQRGAMRVTAALELDRRRLLDLAASVAPGRLEVIVHRHAPMFHSEYCLFCRALSSGANRGDCGRPCERFDVRLRDRKGAEHRLRADSQCRNTLFHAEPEILADMIPDLMERGVHDFRIELLAERTAEEVRRRIGVE